MIDITLCDLASPELCDGVINDFSDLLGHFFVHSLVNFLMHFGGLYLLFLYCALLVNDILFLVGPFHFSHAVFERTDHGLQLLLLVLLARLIVLYQLALD